MDQISFYELKIRNTNKDFGCFYDIPPNVEIIIIAFILHLFYKTLFLKDDVQFNLGITSIVKSFLGNFEFHNLQSVTIMKT